MAFVLLIDDQDRTLELCKRSLPEHSYHGPARSWSEARRLLRRYGQRADVVLLDINFDIPAEDLLGLSDPEDPKALRKARRTQGVLILEKLRASHPELPVILMTARDDLPTALGDQAEEFTHFLEDDDLDANSLGAQIASVTKARRGLEQEGPIYWGRSTPMRRVRRLLETLAKGRLPIIIGGPTGTGKSLLARHFVHPRSGRRGAFVTVDLSTLPPELMAAHLFGSVKGAYTGSIADRKGAFEEADGGTLFLDEVGNLSLDSQKMLLTVLQEGIVTRIGDVRERRVDVKLVVATNEDLAEMVREGRFRSDLYMRLNPACTVVLPSLSERGVDLVKLLGFCADRALAGPYLRELVQSYAEAQGLSTSVRLEVVDADKAPEPKEGCIQLLFPKRSMGLIRKHGWPGNMREFAMTVENALLFTFAELAQLGRLERADVVQVRPRLLRDLLRESGDGRPDAPEDGWKLEVAVRSGDTLNKVAQDVERQYFQAMFFATKGDFQEMARLLMGDPDCARKVQLRFNQLGLKVREMRGRL